MRLRGNSTRWVAAGVCALAGAAVFQFFGNANHGYIKTDSLFWWWGFQWWNPASETQQGWLVLGLAAWLLARGVREGQETWNAERGGRKQEGREIGKAENWETRNEEREIAPLAAMAGALALHAVGFAAQQARVSIVALLLFTWGVLRQGGGRRWGAAAAFPLAFMVFAIPLNVLDSVGFWLRLGVVHASAAIAHAAGIGVIENGTQLVAPDGRYQYDVAAACSGVRSLMALAALSLLIGYLKFRAWGPRLLMLLLCFPLVFVGNVARITAIVLAAQAGGPWWGDVAHEVMGWAIFAIVLGGVLGAGRLLRRWAPEESRRAEGGGRKGENCRIGKAENWETRAQEGAEGVGRTGEVRGPRAEVANPAGGARSTSSASRASRGSDSARQQNSNPAGCGDPALQQTEARWGHRAPPRSASARQTPYVVAGLVVVLAVAEMLFLHRVAGLPPAGRAGVALAADGRDPVELPAILGAEWVGLPAAVTPVERAILPPDTGYSRMQYVSSRAPRRVFLSIVLSGRDRTSIHRPELCLLGQGWTIMGRETHRFVAPGGGAFRCTVLRVVHRGVGGGPAVPQLVAYWFVGDDRVVASYWRRLAWDAWYRIVHGRADRWAYVLLQTDAADGEPAALARMQRVLDRTLPVFEPRRLTTNGHE